MPGVASKISLAWEAAQIVGLGAAFTCLLIMLLPVRARAGSRFVLTLQYHQWLGWAAVAGTLAHAVGTMLADPVALEHLKPTAPYYEWAGVIGLALLLLLSLLSTGAARRRLWQNHRRFQSVHVASACLLVATIAIHVITTRHWVRGRVVEPLFLALCAASLLVLLRARRTGNTMQGGGAPLPGQRLVYGRHSRKIACFVLAGVLVTGSLLNARASVALREQVIVRTAPLRVAFPHEQHREVRCVECHHNFMDRTGSGGCYACHRSTRPDLRVGAEARFHDFCLGCHRSPPRHFEHTGPATGCSTCHRPSPPA